MMTDPQHNDRIKNRLTFELSIQTFPVLSLLMAVRICERDCILDIPNSLRS